MKHLKHIGKTMKFAVLAAAIAGLTQTAGVAAAASLHTAKEGDTFFLLAQRYGVSVDELTKANPNIASNNIYAGLQIKVPGEKSVKAASDSKPQLLTEKAPANEGPTIEAWGKTFNYSKIVDVKASAYSAAADENGKWGAVDYYGNPLKLGTIAVDPNVIPMGTKVLVTGYSHPGLPDHSFVAVARDQGSAITGKRIDIFIPGNKSFVNDFGFQNVKLYVIDK
ncbi:3D domain-containing protein [Paenibacillus polymyxa]|uniref:3D domain-containing protein n=1 Tax=Paenibacillus TaxID=44249 RepID=UPI0020B792D2|nr:MULTISPECIES: 3D domain-containing protein [Paenibacillus]MCP3806320.1 3D domain-containing protein [Paenibacillus sp. Lou8.1]MDY8047297.1 3D domain-containing protein [Paenibacillus polymyxa]